MMTADQELDAGNRSSGRRLLLEELRELHLRQGEPALRTVAKGTKLSISTIHAALTRQDANPSWPAIKAIVEYLDGDLDRFEQLHQLDRAERRHLGARAAALARDLKIDRGLVRDGLAPSPAAVCFWSYTHRDDLLENGRIRRLSSAIGNEYELLTGERLDLFVDNSAISWGDQWREVISTALEKTALFIPIVTPLYLRSEECRREFVEFAGRAASADAMELLLPILYADTPAISDEENDDEVPALIRETKYEDWRTLRLTDENSQEYRLAVHKLASRLVEVVSTVTARPAPVISVDEDDVPGVLDRIGEAEEQVGSWHATFTELVEEVGIIGRIVEETTERFAVNDRRGAGVKGRLVILSGFADKIRDSCEHVGNLGRQFGESVRRADSGVQIVILQARDMGLTDGDREVAESFFETITGFADTVSEMVAQIREFVRQLDQAQSMSRVIRSPLNQMRSGLSAIIDAETVFKGWANLVQGK
jgi:hypothetical protein